MIESEARENNQTYCERKELGFTKSLPTLNAFGKWLAVEFQSGNVLPQSSIGKAIAYTLNRLKMPFAPLLSEKKDYLFAGSHEEVQRAAVVYSFFAMCKMEDVNPAHWLKYVLDNIQDAKINTLEMFYPRSFKNKSKM